MRIILSSSCIVPKTKYSLGGRFRLRPQVILYPLSPLPKYSAFSLSNITFRSKYSPSGEKRSCRWTGSFLNESFLFRFPIREVPIVKRGKNEPQPETEKL